MDWLEKKSPKVTKEAVDKAPQTKSQKLVDMSMELREIAKAKSMKLEAIKLYLKEIEKNVKEDLAMEDIEKTLQKALKELLEKNSELKTATEDLIRLDNETILWFDKTEDKIKNLDLEKLKPEEKATYEILKKEITAKTLEMKELEEKATTMKTHVSKIRLVVMEGQKVVSNVIDLAEIEEVSKLYDKSLNIAELLLGKMELFIKSIGDWFKGLFSK